MKKRGTQQKTEMVSITTEKRGMALNDNTQRFIIRPPSTIPTATAGRFKAPERKQRFIHTYFHKGYFSV